ncbi:MAG: hypothetical protein GTO51_10700 [Candidatus Latescibacteria bacterium]|nr:hypothetical protein [Candidatus Latescibacterota bacterium]NIM66434.1 hypothetical protein [Candidatus Latescibacterota bacterium]NIO02914.1 hypothetical protein [Candidatus Latescibacterota bacterium]NIO30049.1 hypothetical protein [Candidatus Latescibacterota bacterium]NIO57664.1 hypothetical protein [Candidatus Latescibacterota bacterium]
MKLPKYFIIASLVLLYAVSVIIRVASADKSKYPYFDGVSATNYRYMVSISQTGSAPVLDQKAAWPEGVRPALERPLGVEYFTGYVYRLVRYFSEADERQFVRQFTRLFSSLLVFTLYALSYTLWRSQAGALFAGFLVALSSPLIDDTNGTTFLHVQYAAVLVSLHLFLILRLKNRFTIPVAVTAALSFFVLLTMWEASVYYIAIFALLYAIWPEENLRNKRILLSLHGVFFVAGALLLPYLSAHRVAFAVPASLVYSAVLYAFFAGKLPLKERRFWPGMLYVIVGALILSAIFRPLQFGASRSFPALQYVYYRLRYLAAKPIDPSTLPDAVRYVWSKEHAAPSEFNIFIALFPFLFLIPAMVSGALSFQKETSLPTPPPTSVTATRRKPPNILIPAVVAALLIWGLYFFDRSGLPLSVIGAFPLVALSFYAIGRHLKKRSAFIALGAILILAQTLSPDGRLDLSRWIARRAGLNPIGGDFLRVSIGNPDRNLVRFLLTRTSVRDPILGLPAISSLLSTFGGRTTLLFSGGTSRETIEKTVEMLGKYYGSEEELYRTCRANGVEYVLYSVELALDGTTFSPRYLCGRKQLIPASVAYKMHFFPEALKRFALVYENDGHRLFEVTDHIKPIFSTDHPPIYQYEILVRNNDSLELFHERITNLMLLYGNARNEHEAGNDSTALGLFNACVNQAPHFTAARLGQATSLTRLGRLEDARDVYMTIVGYAPDNPEALYGTALTLARLGETARAEGFVSILLSSTGEAEIIRKAKLLKWFIDEGIPIDAPIGTDSNSTISNQNSQVGGSEGPGEAEAR